MAFSHTRTRGPPPIPTIPQQNKDSERITQLGGPAALVKALASSQSDGLSTTTNGPTSLAQRAHHYGTNRLPEIPPKWFIRIWWDTLDDTLIRILIFGAAVCDDGSFV